MLEHNLHSRDFLNSIVSLGLFPTISIPTRFSNAHATLIDNILVSSLHTSEVESGVMLEQISDHQACFLLLKSLKRKKDDHASKHIIITHRNPNFIENVRRDLASVDFMSHLHEDDDPNINYRRFEEIVTDIINRYTETKRVRYKKYRHKRTPWITTGILRSIKFRDKLYIRLKQSDPGSAEHSALQVNLRSYNRILNRIKRAAKTVYYHTNFERYKRDGKQTWKFLNDFLGRHKTTESLTESLNYEGVEYNSKSDVLDCFNKHFSSVGYKLASTHRTTNENEYKTFLPTPFNESFSFREVDKRHVEEIITKKLKNKYSSGHDGISCMLIKEIKSEISEPLTFIINQSISQGIFPESLKIAKVKALYKKGDQTDPTNYRPISLLTAFSKIFEKVLLIQLIAHFNRYSLFYGSQYGFREGHSCELAVLELIDRISSNMDNSEIPFSLFIDLSKAFDCLDHNILINKLEYYGVRGAASLLMQSYLTGRHQYTQHESDKSELQPITYGVPQGSILGPFLFLVYMNDLAQCTRTFSIINYADDTVLSSTICSFTNPLSYNIDQEVNKLSKWLSLNKLSINASKSKIMFFYSKRRNFSPPTIHINGIEIECVEDFKYLGITINRALSWETHVKEISSKISKIIGVMNRIKNTLPSFTLKTIYDALIASSINYGLLVWGGKPGSIAKLQKKVVRIILNTRSRAHSEPLFKRLGILKINDLRTIQELIFFYKFKHNMVPQYFRNNFIHFHFDDHEYPTRQRQRLRLPIIHHEFMRCNLRCTIVKTVQETDSIILDKIDTHSLAGFRNYAQRNIISNYNFICEDRNCYVCNNR